jgi:hypothetical protein
MTATTGVGLGTVAVNSGAIDIDDVSGLLANTTTAVSGSVAGAANPFASSSAPMAPLITAAGVTKDPNATLAEASIDVIPGAAGGLSETNAGSSSGTNSGTSHGTSSGSAGGSYEDDDYEDEDEDEDEDDDEDDDDDEDEDEDEDDDEDDDHDDEDDD